MGHVVGAVPDIGQRQSGQLLLALSDGLQVREYLTGMILVSQAVDHWNARHDLPFPASAAALMSAK